MVSSLVPGKSSGGRGVGRISKEQEQIIEEVIIEYYFSELSPNLKKTHRELKNRCNKKSIPLPSFNTLRSRIARKSLEQTLTKRKGRQIGRRKTEPIPGKYPEVKCPMEVLQIDHTLLDIIVVSENRKPIGRPWITLAIDIYSRMVAGLYISFDTPGTLGTGICIANSMLPKENLISKFKLKSEWPINGTIQNVHSDNAAEFKSRSFMMSCQEYGINLNYRPKGETHWGGHIERLLGNFLSELHLIPGTTFSNPRERGDYNSEKEAVLTLKELEQWLHVFIADVYHNEVHSGISMSPLKKYYEGLLSFEEKLPTGLGNFNFDPIKLKIDFLPAEQRTIQRTGVQIDHIRYFADVLRPYLFISDPTNSLSTTKRRGPHKYIFKRDPRDLSCIYFLEPKQNKYFPIYYADASKPEISIWEHREALKELKRKGKIDKVTEDKIFEAHETLKQIVTDAKSEKKKAKRMTSKRKKEEYLPIKSPTITKTSKANKSDDQGPNFNNIKLFTYSDKL